MYLQKNEGLQGEFTDGEISLRGQVPVITVKHVSL